jgi:hypothetical protein
MNQNGGSSQRSANDQGTVFDPEDLHALALAFDKTCHALGSKRFGLDLPSRIAIAIVDLARRGERDPDRLCALTLNALTAQTDLGQ